jgi:putative nucleotidyltransferase with HDIG domain
MSVMEAAIACETPPAEQSLPVRPTLADLISGLSYGLDLAQGQPMGHAVRSCLIGLRIAEELRLPQAGKSCLYYAGLLKDAGGSANSSRIFHLFGGDETAAKREMSLADCSRIGWDGFHYAVQHVSPDAPFLQRARKLFEAGAKRKSWARELIGLRSEWGAEMVRQMGFPAETAAAVCAAGEHWDGGGYPRGLAGGEIPLAARILSVARTIEVFYTHRCAKHALDAVRERSGSWFDPEAAAAALELSRRGALFADLETGRTREALMAAEPEPEPVSEQRVDDICRAFAEIVDTKSPFTQGHSEGVARTAERMAAALGLKAAEKQNSRRAALLHDLGKLALPNFILEKPDKLEPEEWQAVKKHPFHTLEILRHIEGFGDIAEIAASHHEKLNGSGYYRNLTAARLPLPARIVAVADVFQALTSKRPQRDACPLEKAAKILRSEAGIELDADCVEAILETNL